MSMIGLLLIIGGGLAVYLGVTGKPPLPTLRALIIGQPMPGSA